MITAWASSSPARTTARTYSGSGVSPYFTVTRPAATVSSARHTISSVTSSRMASPRWGRSSSTPRAAASSRPTRPVPGMPTLTPFL